MKTTAELQLLVNDLITKAHEWLSVTTSMGNQDAYTDRMLEDVITASHKLEENYEDQFEKHTYYVLFEQQGYEQLIVRVEATDENSAYDIANEAYLGDCIDRSIIEPTDLGAYDCLLIDQDGSELDYSDYMEDEEEEGDEDNE